MRDDTCRYCTRPIIEDVSGKWHTRATIASLPSSGCNASMSGVHAPALTPPPFSEFTEEQLEMAQMIRAMRAAASLLEDLRPELAGQLDAYARKLMKGLGATTVS